MIGANCHPVCQHPVKWFDVDCAIADAGTDTGGSTGLDAGTASDARAGAGAASDAR